MEQNDLNNKAWYEKVWLVIILCLVLYPIGVYALWKNSKINKVWKIAVTSIIFLFLTVSVYNKDRDTGTTYDYYSEKEASQKLVSDTSADAEIAAMKAKLFDMIDSSSLLNSKWIYSEFIDEMDNYKIKRASVESDNSINFDFPYGKSDFTLVVRNKNSENDVFIKCSSCQFIAGYMGQLCLRCGF